MVQQHFKNFNAAVRNGNLNRATIAANAILHHYNVYTNMPKVYGPIKRIQYALMLQELKNLPGFNALSGSTRWNILKRK